MGAGARAGAQACGQHHCDGGDEHDGNGIVSPAATGPGGAKDEWDLDQPTPGTSGGTQGGDSVPQGASVLSFMGVPPLSAYSALELWNRDPCEPFKQTSLELRALPWAGRTYYLQTGHFTRKYLKRHLRRGISAPVPHGDHDM